MAINPVSGGSQNAAQQFNGSGSGSSNNLGDYARTVYSVSPGNPGSGGSGPGPSNNPGEYSHTVYGISPGDLGVSPGDFGN